MSSSLSDAGPMKAEERKTWELIVRTDPASPALLQLARKYMAMGKPGRALEIAQRVAVVHPTLFEAALVSASALVKLDRLDDARKALNKALGIVEGLADRLEEMSDLFDVVGDGENAYKVGEASKLLKADPVPDEPEEEDSEIRDTEAVPTETLAALYLAQGHTDLAVEVYRRLVEENPDDTELKAKLDNLLSDRDSKQAEEDVGEAEEAHETINNEDQVLEAEGLDMDLEDIEETDLADENVDFDLEEIGEADLEAGSLDEDLEDIDEADLADENVDFDLEEIDEADLEAGSLDMDLEDIDEAGLTDENVVFELEEVDETDLEAGSLDENPEDIDEAGLTSESMDFDLEEIDAASLEAEGFDIDLEDIDEADLVDDSADLELEEVNGAGLESGSLDEDIAEDDTLDVKQDESKKRLAKKLERLKDAARKRRESVEALT